MFKITERKSIYLTRGDIAKIVVSVNDGEGLHTFQPGDIIRFMVFEKSACDNVVLSKSIEITEETTTAEIRLTKEDTKIGDTIHKPVDYWYEVELNPETEPQTIIGYDESGPKVFRLYPEGVKDNE